MASNVNHFHGQGQDFSHHLCHRRGGPLPDVRCPGVNGHAAVHVHLNMNRGVWEIFRVPMNGQPRPRDEEAATDSDALSEGELSEFVVPIRPLSHLLKRFTHAIGGDAETADGTAVGREQVGEAEVNGVDGKLLCHFVQPHLYRAAGVHGTVPSHGPRCRFVGPNTSAGVVEGPEFVRCGGQHAVVVRGHVTKRSEPAAVDERVDVKT